MRGRGQSGALSLGHVAVWLLVLFLLGNFFSGCQWIGGEKKGGTLSLRLKKEIPLINPLINDPETQKVTSLLFIGLTKLDSNLEPQPALAEKWTVSDNGQVFLFTLRDSLKWHDGQLLTADDVVFTYRWLMRGDPLTVAQADVQQVLEDVTALDDRTISFSLRRPYAPFLAATAFPILPRHLLENEPDLLKIPIIVGNGPFSLRLNSQNGVLDLERFENSNETPLLQSVRFVVVPDDSSAVEALADGNLDIAEVSVPNLGSAPQAFLTGKFSELGFNYVGFNVRDGRLFSDKNLRLAWESGVDKKWVVDTATGGNGLPVWTQIPVSSWAYDKSVPVVNRDIDKAKALLKASGWQDTDGDGIAEKDGKKLAFDLFVRKDDSARVKAAQLLSDQLKDIGMKANVKPVDFDKDLSSRRQPPFDFDAMVMGWNLGEDPDDYYLFASGQIPTTDRPSLSNYVGFSSQAFDDLSKKARATYDIKVRKDTYAKTQQLIAAEQPYYFLWSEQTGVIASPKVKGPLHLDSPMYLSEIEKIWVEGTSGN